MAENEVTFEKVALRMCELNDPKDGDLNITQSRSALRCAMQTLSEVKVKHAVGFMIRETAKYRKEEKGA